MTRYLFAALLTILSAGYAPANDDLRSLFRGTAQGRPTAPAPADEPRPVPSRPAAPRSADAVVHLIAVGDSTDSQIGPKVADDARNTAALFEESFRAAGKADRLRVKLVLGREVTSSGVLAAVRGLDVRPDDAVVVLVSSHGSIDRGDRPGMDFGRGDRLPTADLLAAMAATGARLTVLLTDVCNGYSGAPGGARRKAPPRGTPAPPPADEDDAPRPRKPTGDGGDRGTPRGGRVIPWATVEHLFLSHRGVVDITAAAPGQLAAVDARGPGSHFTNAVIEVLTTPHPSLVSALDRNGDRAIQWAELLPQVRTVAAARHRTAGGVGSGGPQQATARALGTWAPAGRVAAAE